MRSDILDRVAVELGPRGDRELWDLIVPLVVARVDRVQRETEPRVRELLLRLALVPRHSRAVHPDDEAYWRLCWIRSRDSDSWTYAGPNPRVRRRRGTFSATACVPTGTQRAAYVAVELLWRPRLPWAPPDDTENGREILTFTRDGASRWHHRGTRTCT